MKEYVRDDGMKIRLDAYKTKNKAALLDQQQFSGLKWFSLGQPEIVKINAQSMFEFTKLSFNLKFFNFHTFKILRNYFFFNSHI